MKIAGCVLISLLSFNAYATTLLQESFDAADGMNLGSIHGQNGWNLDSGSGTVQSNQVHSGTQALEILDGQVSHDLSSTGTAVWVNFQARISSVPESNPPLSGLGDGVVFFVNTNLNLMALSNSIPVELNVQMPTNVWTRFDVYCDYEGAFWNLSMGGVTIVSGFPLPTSVQQVGSLVVGNGGNGSGYIDQIDVTDHEQLSSTGAMDADSDGIPDWWEQKYFGAATAADATAMASNGVHTLLETYIAGLSPSGNFAVTMGSSLQWDGQEGRLYAVQSTTNLTTGFVTVASNIPWDQTSYLVNTTNNACFYKVSVELDD